MNTRPTPETDAHTGYFGIDSAVNADFARQLERERDEAREALTTMAKLNRSISESRKAHEKNFRRSEVLQLEAAKKIEEMRVAIQDAHLALSEVMSRSTPYVQSRHVVRMSESLSKLQPLLKP